MIYDENKKNVFQMEHNEPLRQFLALTTLHHISSFSAIKFTSSKTDVN